MNETENRVPAAATPMGRVVAIWFPDWPALAALADAGLPADAPLAVVAGNRVTACTATARAQGVRRGIRRREAQSRCPGVRIAAEDAQRDARAFEPVLAELDEIAPRGEILRPGLLVLSLHGIARYHGGEPAAAEALVDAAARAGHECQTGIADRILTAVLAARQGRIVPPGGDRDYLADRPIADLAAEPSLSAPDRHELVHLLHRLGIRTIGDYAALSARHVASRFGNDAITAHRRARGEPDRPPSGLPTPPGLEIEHDYDPPIERVDAAAFAGRALATELHGKLAAIGVACTRLRVQARAAEGASHERTWHCAQPLTPESTADRIRWQLDGWLSRRDAGRSTGPAGGITTLRLEPVEVVTASGLQLGLWGQAGAREERARRAVVRVQALLGGDAVQAPATQGGRAPRARIITSPHGEHQVVVHPPGAPWPGALPPPAPVWLPDPPRPVRLLDGAGTPIQVSGRGILTAVPGYLHDQGRSSRIIAWAGPWCLDEEWWDPDAGQRAARLQVITHPGRAYLLVSSRQEWAIEGIWD